MQAKENILVISTANFFSGHEKMGEFLIKELSRLFCLVELICPTSNSLSSRTRNFCRHIKPFGWLLSLPSNFCFLLFGTYYLLFLSPNLVLFLNGDLRSNSLLVFIAFLAKKRIYIYVPLVESFSTYNYKLPKIRDILFKSFIAKLNIIWIVPHKSLRFLFRKWSKTKSKVHVLPNTAASGNIKNLPLNTRFFKVCIVGRFDKYQKGLDIFLSFIRSHSFIFKQNIRFNLYGAGSYKKTMIDFVRKNNFTSFVNFHRWSTFDLICRQNNLLMLFSRFEGVPVVITEAMGAGLPILSTKLPGTCFLEPSCLFKHSSLKRLPSALNNFKNPVFYKKIQKRNIIRFKRLFSKNVFRKSVYAIFRDEF